MRSRAAASVLATSGFNEVYSMEGGIRAWEGQTASGAPELGMAFFPDSASVENLVGLAWILEKGTGTFYEALLKILNDAGAGDLFRKLVQAEEQHKASLEKLHKSLTGAPFTPEAFEKTIGLSDDIMEGGVSVSQSLSWAAGKNIDEVLDFAMALETSSYDLYIRMTRKVRDKRSQEVFSLLAKEENDHLKQFDALRSARM